MAIDDGPELVYGFIACFIAGIWLVVNRYETVRSRAVPFTWPAPEVSHGELLFISPGSKYLL